VRQQSAAHEELARRHCALLAEAAADRVPCASPRRLHQALHAALKVWAAWTGRCTLPSLPPPASQILLIQPTAHLQHQTRH